jgi:fumarylacetoacetase
MKTSWVTVPDHSDFSIYNIPFGVFNTPTTATRVASRIGDYVVDVFVFAELGFLDDIQFDKNVLKKATLNDFIACGNTVWRVVRQKLQDFLTGTPDAAKTQEYVNKGLLLPIEKVQSLLPVEIGDYTDFYSSIEHATNVGAMFRPDNPLLPNWKHIPIGYHGRASSIVVSGTNFHRPKGQFKLADQENPSFGASRQMDFELEFAFIIGKGNALGTTIPVEKAEEHIFGFVLFNDWSARDIQSWEYQPLGPFLGKNFCSSMSAWVVTLDALAPFRVATPTHDDTPILPYLQETGNKNFDINLEVAIQPQGQTETVVCRSNTKYLYWSATQQLAHHTVNGCNSRIGDVYASGTISGKDKNSFGSLLELTWRGTQPLKMADGSERRFLQDNDTVIMRGYAEKDGIRVGFGEVVGQLLPAL